MKTRTKLTSDGIVQAALKMLDENGEKQFSMRKLATALQVDPMAIYHYHASKSALLAAAVQAMMASFDTSDLSGNWKKDIRALCCELRKVGHRHPGTFRVYETFEDWLPAEHKVNEAFHATLISAGFSPENSVRAVRILYAYTEAFVVDEISGWLDPEDRDDLTDSLSQGPYPVLQSLVDELVNRDIEREFEFGLSVLIAGLEAEAKTSV